MAHSKEKIEERIKSSLIEIDKFYKAKFNNYIGVTSDTKESYSEIIVSEILNNITLFKKIDTIPRGSKSYYTESHYNGEILINEDSNRHEENYAKKIFSNKINHNHLGKIIDYQVPLKDKKSDSLGKIDLISFNKDTSTIYLIELKYGDNQESLLRAILEVHTYCKIIDYLKLKDDFKHLLSDDVYDIKPAVMVVNNPIKKNCKSYVELEELERGERVNLKQLSKEFEITFFKSANGETFEMVKF